MKIVNMAKVVVIDRNGKVLLMRRGETNETRRPGTWDFPGGGVEGGESFDQAVIREAREEAGLELLQVKLVYTKTEYVRKLSHSVNRALFVTYLDDIEPPVDLSFEHTEYKWVSKQEAIQEFPHPFYGVGLKYALDHRLIAS